MLHRYNIGTTCLKPALTFSVGNCFVGAWRFILYPKNHAVRRILNFTKQCEWMPTPDPMTSHAVSECYGAMTVKSSRMGANFMWCQLHFACSLQWMIAVWLVEDPVFSLLTCNIYELKSAHHLLPSMLSLICKHSPHTSRIVWACLSTRSISCTPCQIWPICPTAASKKPHRKSQWSDWSLSLTFEHTPRTQWIVGWTRSMWPQTSKPKENQQIWRVRCRKFWSGSGWSIASELAALVTSPIQCDYLQQYILPHLGCCKVAPCCPGAVSSQNPAAGGWGTPMSVSSLTSTSACMQQVRRFTCTEEDDSQLTGMEEIWRSTRCRKFARAGVYN